MDPLSAIGLASAIVQFIDFGFKVAKRLDEFNSKNPGEVPRSLQAISTQLPLLLNALSRIKSDAQIKNLDFDTKCILRGMVSGCQAQIVEIEGMVNELSRVEGESFGNKIKKVFTSLKYDEKLSEIQRNLHTYISVLILHHVIDTADIPSPPVEDAFFDVREKRIVPFIPRAQMQELESYFYTASRSQTTQPLILLLTGAPGTGKTLLALEFCFQSYELRQFRSVFWIDASTLENVYLGYESMYATIQHSTHGSRNEKVAFVQNFLNDLWHPWLLVLDNYEPALLYNDILTLLPSRGYGGILLITSQQADSGLGKVLCVPRFVGREEQTRLDEELVREVQRKDEQGIRRAVEAGAYVDALIWEQWPVLHRCSLFGLEDSVSYLLSKNANPNPPNINIRSPIFWAASGGHKSICRILLDHEDDIGIKGSRVEYQATFNEAAEKGNLEIMQMLFKRRNIELNSKNQYDSTPLQSAAKNGHVDVVRFLIDEGALQEDHAQGDQALISAASSNYLSIVKLLISSGKVSPNAVDGQGRSALCYVAESKDRDMNQGNGIEMAKFLFQKGADPNPLNGKDGPLHQAAIHDHVEMVTLLLGHGADPTRDAGGWDPLTNAIRFKSPGAITLLLDAKVDNTAARNSWLEAGLRSACRAGDRGVVLQLLLAGTDIDAVEENGVSKGASPLLLAIMNEHVKVAQLLVRRGARQDLKDEQGRMTLPVAAERGFEMVVRDLIRSGGGPNLKSGENEDTPLILAAAKGHEKVVKVLLENGADKDLMNKFGEMALDVAEEKGNKEVIKFLE